MVPVYEVNIDDPTSILTFLRRYLPKSLPLYRLIQHPHKSRNCRILSTASLSSQETVGNDASAFAAACLVRANPPGASTAGCLFSSLELASGATDEDDKGLQHVLALLEHFRQVTINEPIATPQTETEPDVIKITCLDSRTRQLLRDTGVIDDHDVTGGPYTKFLIHSGSSSREPEGHSKTNGFVTKSYHTTPETLPVGMVFDTIREKDYETVVANNPFVTSTVLPQFSSAAIRVDEELAAWAFIKHDGSIGALYCMPHFRRRGLARKVVQRLLQSMPEYYDHLDNYWCHTDVEESNVSSIKVFESLGAERAWQGYWSRIHLERVSKALKHES